MYSSLFLESYLILNGYSYSMNDDMIQEYYNHINSNIKEEIV